MFEIDNDILLDKHKGKYFLIDNRSKDHIQINEHLYDLIKYPNKKRLKDQNKIYEDDEVLRAFKKKSLIKGDYYTKPNIDYSNKTLITELLNKFKSLLFLKIIIIKPDLFIENNKWLYSFFKKPVIYTNLFLFLIAIYLLLPQVSGFITYSSLTIYKPETWILTGFCFILTKTFHEFGHAIAQKKAGGYVSGIGVILIKGLPLPFSEGKLLHKASRNEKIKIALAGVYFESWIALFCIYIWLFLPNNESRVVFHFLAFISFSLTLTANLLPFMKLDGYLLISSIMNKQYLYEDAQKWFTYDRYKLLGFESEKPMLNHSYDCRNCLLLYGFAIWLWRTFLPISIIIGISYFFGFENLGLSLAICVILTMYVLPIINEFNTLREKGKPKITKLNTIIVIFILSVIAYIFLPLQHNSIHPASINIDYENVIVQIDGKSIENLKQKNVNKGELITSLINNNIKLEKNRLLNEMKKNTQDVVNAHEIHIIKTRYIDKIKSLELKGKEKKIIAKIDGVFVPTTNKDFWSKGESIGRIYKKNNLAIVKIYINKKIKNDKILVDIVTNEKTYRNLYATKISEVVTSNSLPDFMKQKNGGKILGDTTIIPYSVWEVKIKHDIRESIAKAKISTRYRIIDKIKNKLNI